MQYIHTSSTDRPQRKVYPQALTPTSSASEVSGRVLCTPQDQKNKYGPIRRRQCLIDKKVTSIVTTVA